jgi:hypothetical protein
VLVNVISRKATCRHLPSWSRSIFELPAPPWPQATAVPGISLRGPAPVPPADDVCHARPVKITKPMALGLVFALAGHGLAVGITVALAIAGGGGPHADLDAGGRFAGLIFGVLTYAIAQLVLLGTCVALSGRLGAGAAQGLTVGWLLGLAMSLFYLCGGLSI